MPVLGKYVGTEDTIEMSLPTLEFVREISLDQVEESTMGLKPLVECEALLLVSGKGFGHGGNLASGWIEDDRPVV